MNLYGVGTPGKITLAAQWLACTIPCRRFADILADTCARLGVDVDSYSVIVTDFQRLLFAGLRAHKLLILLTGCSSSTPLDLQLLLYNPAS
jgi:hypothetical protein